MFKKKKVLVTGAAGFIGSHMCEFLLKKNFKVVGIDNFSGGNKKNIKKFLNNTNFKFCKFDLLTDKYKSNIFEVDYAIHFAGIGDIVPSIEFPIKYIDNNFNGTKNLLSYLNFKKVKKLVYAASSSCYGLAKTPTKENCQISTMHPYALSKYLGEILCLNWAKIYNAPINSIRIFNAYGTRSRTSGAYGAVMGTFIKQLISKKPLTVVGDGSQKRDFVYVTDVVNAFYQAMITKKSGEIWNLGSGKPQSINYLIKLLKYGKKIFIKTRPGEPYITHADISKIKKDLKWKPKITFAQGIKKILEQKNYWLDAPLWTVKKIQKATKNWFIFLQK